MDPRELLQERLRGLEGKSLKRSLSRRLGLDLSSNDYLGFAGDPVLLERVQRRAAAAPLGATGSRLLRGHLELYESVEAELAEFSGKEAALLFHSGYQANIGLLSALLKEGDLVFSDERNHASIIDGIRLSAAGKVIYPHNDVAALRRILSAQPASGGLRVIVTESLFSMDGAFAPLRELVALAKEFSALLVVDEAHATGLWGNFEENRGGGIVQSLGLSSEVFATIHTGGKSLGSGGAWVAGDSTLKEYLVNFSRPFIFSTAIVPVVAISLAEAVHYWKEVGVLRAKEVHERSAFLCRRLMELAVLSTDRGMSRTELPSPILPILLGSSERALSVSRRLQERGYDVRAIRPPTVAEGTSRLRITLHWQSSPSELENFATALENTLREDVGYA